MSITQAHAFLADLSANQRAITNSGAWRLEYEVIKRGPVFVLSSLYAQRQAHRRFPVGLTYTGADIARKLAALG